MAPGALFQVNSTFVSLSHKKGSYKRIFEELEEDNNLNHPHEAGLLQLDIQKADNQLGWTPKMTSQEAIAQTMDWYKNYEEDPLGCMTRQIGKYFES